MKKPVQKPGSRGGVFWVDHRGTVRYDDPPTPGYGRPSVELHPIPTAVPGLHEQSPATIDTVLAKLRGDYMTHVGRIHKAFDTLGDLEKRHKLDGDALIAKLDPDPSVKYLMSYDAQRLRSARETIKTERPIVARLAAKMAPYDQEYRRRPWSRFYLVVNEDGHVHKSLHCSTCHMTTEFSWLSELSGQPEKAAVEEFGRSMCTVCFPTAPTDFIGRRERATLVEKTSARNAKADAYRAALEKGLGHPTRIRRDGMPELWFKTERAAYEELQRRAHDLNRAAQDRPAKGFPGVWTGPEGKTSLAPPKIKDNTGKVRVASIWELE